MKTFAAIPQVSEIATVPAPTLGLNTFDAIANMPPGYALQLRNFYPQAYGCQLRKGYVLHASVSGQVNTLMSHNKSTGEKLYAAFDDTQIADVTAPNGVPIPVSVTATNDKWQSVNFSNVAGVNLVAVNGADEPLWFKPDGTHTQITASNITGVDPKKFVHICAHQARLWFVEKDSTRGWYLPPEVVTGVAVEFDFAGVMSNGGYLVQLITWSLDSGNGSDDHLCAISSQGEVAVYSGIDPSDFTTWKLDGVFHAGIPIGRRCASRYGGDVVIITLTGLVFLSDLLKSTKINPTAENAAQKIQLSLSQLASETYLDFGWQPFTAPGLNMFLLNCIDTTGRKIQYVMNDVLKAWCIFNGYEASCWETHVNLPFFGGDSAIYRAWETNTDGAVIDGSGNVTEGLPIAGDLRTAFSFFGTPNTKHFKMIRMTFLNESAFSYQVAINVDFKFSSVAAPVASSNLIDYYWDQDLWDTALWSIGLETSRDWIGVSNIGTAASLGISLVASCGVVYVSTDWLVAKGGVF